MDIFKFTNPTSPGKMEQGQIINGLDTKMWIERYGKEGEFTFTAKAETGMRDILPIGSFISHLNSTYIMIVENHEINDTVTDAAPIITITGRGYETFFENRIIGSNRAFPVVEAISDYLLASDYTWNQVVALISDHALATFLVDNNNEVPFMSPLSLVTTFSSIPTSNPRQLKRDNVYNGILSLLAIDGLGIKVVRPGPWSPLGPTDPNVCVGVHFGVDRHADVIFSYDAGQVQSADYLWSNKTFKNSALVTGKWVEMFVAPMAVQYERRVMFIDGTDIDQNFVAAPTGPDLAAVEFTMNLRGVEVLAAQRTVAITKAVISPSDLVYEFRSDYDLGDIVTVRGDYNAVSQMQVTEHVETEDANGESAYPTLVLV